ncbi:putative phosphoesterase [Arcticibacter svalbardensis MN12-7]|uniref:Putative phosphoesterase n=1 Tax=Arcticibacter svalbardensis MN12-7 TaxID=1150600 RepID=R9H3N9_9SPHI|nr:metallophosphoesterase [Arcticibacter svalbardensis]EOR95804.1 putative phosphoesterase [Arcticibacter svalbardensis MN12-7]
MNKARLPILLSIVLLVVVLLNWYIISGFYLVLSNPVIIPSFCILLGVLIVALAYAIMRMRITGMTAFSKTVSHSFLILVITELVFASVLLLGDIYRAFKGLFTFVFSHDQFIYPTRSIYVIELAILLSALCCVFIVYGIIYGKYAYRVIKHTLYFDDLPAAFDGFTITQISDIHAGSFGNKKAVQKGIDLIKQQKSDLFVFTGDLVNNKAEEIAPWIKQFSSIKAPYGQFSILGNHDYGDYIRWPDPLSKSKNLQKLKEYHVQLGFKLLLDEHVEIHKDGDTLILAGVENWGIGFGERGDIKKAFQNVKEEQFKVLLSHDPTHWETIVKNYPIKVHLTLAGHTHGMQFGLEALGIKWSPVKYRYPHWAGIASFNDRYLNINRGFGFLGFSGRVGIWPEITVIELRKH